MRAEQVPVNSPTGTGSYHLRLAEILLSRDNLPQALDHLNQANRYFLQGQQVSNQVRAEFWWC